ncbi:MAG: GGDEF domain-containing protein, partial [Deinococcota bacterium]
MQAVSVDALTGVGLRDGMALYLRESLQRSQLEQHPVALLVIDVDYLKLLNDAFGHQTGDKALLTVVDVVRTHLADAGQVFRYGG